MPLTASVVVKKKVDLATRALPHRHRAPVVTVTLNLGDAKQAKTDVVVAPKKMTGQRLRCLPGSL